MYDAFEHLTPFQKRTYKALDEDDECIVLQDRRTGLTTSMAACAEAYAVAGNDVLYTSPDKYTNERFFQQLSKILRIDDIEPERFDPTAGEAQLDVESPATIWAMKDEETVRGETADLVLLDNAQYLMPSTFDEAVVPMLMTNPDLKILVGATGMDQGTENALHEAISYGGFRLVWTDLRTAEANKAHGPGEPKSDLPPGAVQNQEVTSHPDH